MIAAKLAKFVFIVTLLLTVDTGGPEKELLFSVLDADGLVIEIVCLSCFGFGFRVALMGVLDISGAVIGVCVVGSWLAVSLGKGPCSVQPKTLIWCLIL